MKYLITGCHGQLGYDLVRELDRRGERKYLALGRDEMDITNRKQVFDQVRSIILMLLFIVQHGLQLIRRKRKKIKLEKLMLVVQEILSMYL